MQPRSALSVAPDEDFLEKATSKQFRSESDEQSQEQVDSGDNDDDDDDGGDDGDSDSKAGASGAGAGAGAGANPDLGVLIETPYSRHKTTASAPAPPRSSSAPSIGSQFAAEQEALELASARLDLQHQHMSLHAAVIDNALWRRRFMVGRVIVVVIMWADTIVRMVTA